MFRLTAVVLVALAAVIYSFVINAQDGHWDPFLGFGIAMGLFLLVYVIICEVDEFKHRHDPPEVADIGRLIKPKLYTGEEATPGNEQ